MKAHRTDLLSLAFGLLFLATAAWWLLAQLLGLVVPLGWLLAGVLVVIGALGLLGAVRAARWSSPRPAPAPGLPFPGSPVGPLSPGAGLQDPAGTGTTGGQSSTGTTGEPAGTDASGRWHGGGRPSGGPA